MFTVIKKSMITVGVKVSNLTNTEHILAFLISGITFVVGDWTTAMTMVIVLQVIDVLTGLMIGKSKDGLSSGKLKEGAQSKFGSWLYIVVGNVIDVIWLGATGLPIAKTFVVSYIVTMELISITENAERLGAPRISFVTKYLAQVKNKMDNSTVESSSDEKDK